MSDFDNVTARMDWPSIKQGDTLRAIQFNASGTESALARVRCKVKDADGVTLLSLDSDTTGITIDTATAGSWQYTIDQIGRAITETIKSGLHSYDIETTDADGVVETHFEGCWNVGPQITD